MDQSVKHLRSYSSGNRGGRAWMFQRISGVALVVLTIGHYFMMHYAAKSGHDFGSTAERLANPVFKGIYLAFITIGMYHGVQGLWNIVRDFRLKPGVTYTILGCLFVAAIVFLGIGWNTMLTFDPAKP